jgi:hypothetical protein
MWWFDSLTCPSQSLSLSIPLTPPVTAAPLRRFRTPAMLRRLLLCQFPGVAVLARAPTRDPREP